MEAKRQIEQEKLSVFQKILKVIFIFGAYIAIFGWNFSEFILRLLYTDKWNEEYRYKYVDLKTNVKQENCVCFAKFFIVYLYNGYKWNF